MEDITAEDIRRKLRPVLNRIQRGEKFRLMRYDEPAAILVSPEWFEKADALMKASGENGEQS